MNDSIWYIKRALLGIMISILLMPSTFAVLRDHQGIFRAGFELELAFRYFAKIVDDFNWDTIPQDLYNSIENDIIHELYKDYPLNNRNFLKIIPVELLAQLTDGLNLKEVPLEIRENELIYRRGPTLAAQKQNDEIQLMSRSFSMPAISAEQVKNKDEVLLGGDWKVLNERWNALPPDIKKEYGKLKYGTRKVRAKLAINWLVQGDKAQTLIQLRQDLHQKIKKIYHNLRFFKDMEAIEFHQIEPKKNIMQFRQDLRNFAQYVGVELFLDNPFIGLLNLPGLKGNSLHIHISSIDGAPFDRKVVEAYNLLLVLQAINADRGESVLQPDSQTRFSEITKKGLLRLIGDNRIELRYFTRGFEQTLDFLFTHLRLPPTEALKSMGKQMQIEMEKGAYRWLQTFGYRNNTVMGSFYDIFFHTYSMQEILQLNGAWGLPDRPITYARKIYDLNIFIPDIKDAIKLAEPFEQQLFKSDLIYWLKDNVYSSDYYNRKLLTLLLIDIQSKHADFYISNISSSEAKKLIVKLTNIIVEVRTHHFATNDYRNDLIQLAHILLQKKRTADLNIINFFITPANKTGKVLKTLIRSHPNAFSHPLSDWTYLPSQNSPIKGISIDKQFITFLAKIAQDTPEFDKSIKAFYKNMVTAHTYNSYI